MDDEGIVEYDDFGRANRSYLQKDVKKSERMPSDVRRTLSHTLHKDKRADKNYMVNYESNDFVDDTHRKIRPSDWYVRGIDFNEDDDYNIERGY